MQLVIFLAVLGVSAAFPQAFTPEVQAERAKFFRMFEQAALAAAVAPDAQQAEAAPSTGLGKSISAATAPKPLASTIPAGLPGSLPHVLDSPEVAAAKKAFQAAVDAQMRLITPNQIPAGGEKPAAAPAIPPEVILVRVHKKPTDPIGFPGTFQTVRDLPPTPEIQHYMSQFNHAYTHALAVQARQRAQALAAQAKASAAPAPAPASSASPAPANAPAVPGGWIGPLAASVPAGLPGSSNVVDTLDVSAARAAFQQAYQAQLAAVQPAAPKA